MRYAIVFRLFVAFVLNELLLHSETLGESLASFATTVIIESVEKFVCLKTSSVCRMKSLLDKKKMLFRKHLVLLN